MDKGEPQEGEMDEPKKEKIYGEDEKDNFYVSGSPVKDKKGNVLGAIEVAMDISKKEREKERNFSILY
ncbi:hypothetical protein C9439_05605 [archaeon SCG-AAA382B04]|nr:hypothetical protein C9439_05605 [archaeon SCG-AAA382B04]